MWIALSPSLFCRRSRRWASHRGAVNLERVRKVVAKRNFEAHELMLRSYYAVKVSASPQVDFSRIVGSSFALQHCIRLLS
jgi:hypothetical protein